MENTRRNFDDYIRNTQLPNSTITFPKDELVRDPIFRTIIGRDDELKEFFGIRIPRIINGANYEVKAEAGTGTFSRVIIAKHKTKHELVVVKMPKTFRVQSEDDLGAMLMEYMYQAKAYRALKGKSCRAPNPRGFIRWRSGQGEAVMYMMVSSFCSVVSQGMIHLSMDKAIREHRAGRPILTTTDWREVCLALIDGLQTFNSGGMCHNDIKNDNIMLHRVDNTFQPMLIDFGSCRSLTRRYSAKVFESQRGQNTEALFPHTAPELFHHKNPLPTSDLYGMAHTLATLGHSLKLSSLQTMAENYKKQSPTERKEHSFLHSQVTRCFNETETNNNQENTYEDTNRKRVEQEAEGRSDTSSEESRGGMKRKREMDSASLSQSKHARIN